VRGTTFPATPSSSAARYFGDPGNRTNVMTEALEGLDETDSPGAARSPESEGA